MQCSEVGSPYSQTTQITVHVNRQPLTVFEMLPTNGVYTPGSSTIKAVFNKDLNCQWPWTYTQRVRMLWQEQQQLMSNHLLCRNNELTVAFDASVPLYDMVGATIQTTVERSQGKYKEELASEVSWQFEIGQISNPNLLSATVSLRACFLCWSGTCMPILSLTSLPMLCL